MCLFQQENGRMQMIREVRLHYWLTVAPGDSPAHCQHTLTDKAGGLPTRPIFGNQACHKAARLRQTWDRFP